MSKIALSGNASGTGTFTIASPGTSTDRTLTLPDNSGTVLTTATPGVPVNGPAFSATGSTSVASSTLTKLTPNTEQFDTNSNYDNVTNYRFTPTIAGYYQLSYGMRITTAATAYIILYKNGVDLGYATSQSNGATITNFTSSVLVYANGSTDYFELYCAHFSGTTQSMTNIYFTGALVRAA